MGKHGHGSRESRDAHPASRAWSHFKAKLADFDRAGWGGLVQAMWMARKVPCRCLCRGSWWKVRRAFEQRADKRAALSSESAITTLIIFNPVGAREVTP